MNKNAIQKYAIWARNELIEQVKQRAYQFGISDKGYGDENAAVIAGRVLSAEERQQRHSFVAEIQKNGIQQAVEEVAYTWFNRFVALRFMEVNDYLPTHVRMFSDASGGFNPEILKDVLHLDLPGLDKAKVSDLINANKTEELYRYLLLTQCNALNSALPEMFEKLGSYTEMLLPNSILKPDSVLGRLVTDIPEEDFRDAVQIIGWMYQYYNTEPKQAVFDGLKKNVKISKEKIPAATQLFTPDWIVRYMVENSLGRLWLESHPNAALKANWKYYLDEAEQTLEVAEKLRVLRSQSPVKSPEDIRLIDPCMGSGHILVYAFDVLMQIYESEGYDPRDAAKLILEKNLYGLDIDRRAYQLAYFSLMMKARQYNRRIFTEDVKPQVYHPAGFSDGEEYGSLVKVDKLEPMPELPKEQQITLFEGSYEAKLNSWNFKRLLAQRYDVVVTNPPYISSGNIGEKLLNYLKKEYSIAKNDTYSAFIVKCRTMTKVNCFYAMITIQGWMFTQRFEELRETLLHDMLSTMLHVGYNSFPELNSKIAQGTSFVFRRCHIADFISKYFDLTNNVPQSANKQAVFEDKFALNDFILICNKKYEQLPGYQFAYWVSSNLLDDFTNGKKLGVIAAPRQGLATGDNDTFLRSWFEVAYRKIGFGYLSSEEFHKSPYLYAPYNKGGEFRKWYGNRDLLIKFDSINYDILQNQGNHLPSKQYYFSECTTWSALTTSSFSCRYCESGFVFDTKGSSCFCGSTDELYTYMGFLNSCVANEILKMLSPTVDYNAGTVANVPILESINETVVQLVSKCISLSRLDWDAFEYSWDYARHPLVRDVPSISEAYAAWNTECSDRFDALKAYEEELNCIFIDIYGLQDELTPEVEDKDVTVRPADLKREVRSLISYAVGCMFGRYSLDTDGLTYAGGDWNAGKYRSFIPDKDNILPICDDEYFDDDIVGRFVDFIRVAYGAETLEDNLKFIADSLGGKGTPREVIRNYFLNDFYADHCKIYQKRPIYWLFDSGKKNGFKALVYLHRYSRDLLAKLRTDYVHEQQERYRTQLSHIATALNTATGAERARLLKQQDKLSEQLKEITAFEEKVHHLADMNITIDLDDGVKKNYEIFADVLAKI
jgi:Eco57I restriction endonuclease.